MVLRISTHTTLLRRFLRPKPYFPSSLAASVLHRRHLSSHSSRGQLLEFDLQSVSSSDGETEVVGVKKLEDMIHRIIVLKSTPDWLPFLPGSSFWVPPRTDCRSPADLAQLMFTMSNHGHGPASGKEALSLSAFQLRPSSFHQGAALRHTSNEDVEEAEEVDNEEIEQMLAEVEAEAEAAEAAAAAEAEAEAEGEAEAEVEAEAEAAAESKSQVPTNSGKTSQSENEEG